MVFLLIKFAIKDFIDDRKLKNVSPHSLQGYKRTLDEFHQFCVENQRIDMSNVIHLLVKSYFIHCQCERDNSPVTLNHKLINLRAFLNYAQSELELYDEKSNPIRKISRFRTDVKIEVFSDYHIRQMLLYFRRLKQREKTFYAVSVFVNRKVDHLANRIVDHPGRNVSQQSGVFFRCSEEGYI